VSQGTCNTTPVPRIFMLSFIINSLTKSDLGWPTLLIMSVTMTSFKNGAPFTKQPLDPRANIKTNKPLTIIPQVLVYHVMPCNVIFTVFYIHAFHKLIIFIILSLITHFHKIELLIKKYVSCELYTCMFWYTK